MYAVGGNFMMHLFPIIFVIMFVFIAVMFGVTFVRNISRWNKNNASPVLSVTAVAVAKRMNVTHHHHSANDTMMTNSNTYYYVTFQVESGDRMELPVPAGEYGMIVEGDKGKLTFQGTRFHSFQRGSY